MNTQDSASDETLPLPEDAFEAALVEHLLDEHDRQGAADEIVVVGEPPGWRYWHQVSTNHDPQVLIYPTLDRCLDELSIEHDSAHDNADETGHTRTALIQLDARTDQRQRSTRSGELPRELSQVLGESVRCFPHRLVVSTASDTADDAAFFAFGFRRLQLAGQASIRLYEYSLSEYKQAPDWLNAKYWANPERFDMDPTEDHDDEDDDEEE